MLVYYEQSQTIEEPILDEQLKHLFDYTKFHIGMYTTLVAAIIGIFATDSLNDAYKTTMLPFLLASVVFFCLAGAFGGLVASSIPLFKTFDQFKTARLWLWSTKPNVGLRAMTCTHLEHSSFWIGCMIAVAGLFVSLLGR